MTLFTQSAVTSQTASSTLKNIYPKKHILVDSEDQLFIGEFPKEFCVDYTPDELITNPSFLFTESFIKQVPIINAHCTDIQYHSVSIARDVIKALLELYPEAYIYDDDFMWLGSAKEYIESKHQEDPNYKGPNFIEK